MIAAALLALALTAWPPAGCEPLGTYRITGYVRGHHSNYTYDGTSIWNGEHLVAASWNVPIGTYVNIEGLDYTYRVADRGGGLGPRHIDVLVDDLATAYALEAWTDGGYAQVCIVKE